MGIRKERNIEITSCIPLISQYVKNLEDYKNKLRDLRKDVEKEVKKMLKNSDVVIYLNTRDDYDNDDLYMTLIGSAIESGDEGAVGRGNRSRGVIPFSRNFSMEAACGKNPVYHTGKLFTAIGDCISKKIYELYHVENVVYCTSKMGDKIENPWNVSIELSKKLSEKDYEDIDELVNKIIKNHSEITNEIINNSIKLNSY